MNLANIFQIKSITIITCIVINVLFFGTFVKSAIPLHEQAVLLARQGDHKGAIEILEDLRQDHPDAIELIEDLVVINNWAGAHERAATLYESRPPTRLKLYVHKAALDSYSKLDRLAEATEVVDYLLTKTKNRSDYISSKVLLLSLQLQYNAAHKLLESSRSEFKNPAEYYKLSASLYKEQKQWIRALADYQKMQELEGGPTVIKAQVEVLNHLRAAASSIDIYRQQKELFSTKDRAILLLNEAARNLRWSTDATVSFAEAEDFALQAMAKQLRALELLEQVETQKNWSLPVLDDMVVTLRNLTRMKDVETLTWQLEKLQSPPAYVIDSAAGAKLANKKPDESKKLYSELLEYTPSGYQQQIGLFYSHVELEEFDEAYELIDQMHNKEPVYIKTKSKQQPYPNYRYLKLDVTSTLARFYADQLEIAWNRADSLVLNAPNNNWLWEVRGQIANARGWHNRALYDYHYASLLEPDSLDAIVGKANSLLALGRFEEAREPIKDAATRFPREHATRRLLRQWEISRKPTYFADITWSRSSGPEIDGDSIVASAELTSSPLDDQLYFSGFYRYAWAELIEGEETYKRSGVALDYVAPEYRFVASLTDNRANISEIGGYLQSAWIPDDHLRIQLRGERFSPDTPIRALYHGIRSDKASGSFRYRWSEQRYLFLASSSSWFTDENRRLEYLGIFSERLLDIPHYDLDFRLEGSGSTNRFTDVPYYSPEWDLTIRGALHLDHVYWRRHDHLLGHQFDLGYGYYYQQGYQPEWVGNIRYEQRYKLTPWVEMLAGFEIGRGVYDGTPEPYRLIRLMITGRIN